jgi:hypothetical protein
MNQIADPELNKRIVKVQFEARKLNELEREGKGFELMKTLKVIELGVQLAQARLAELP